ncbi:MAG TPA: Crp/Fnr family transcriptional regulator [Pseudonocardiaceae bacterium]|jgi:CRP-like cAMP-binding protein|nr:Crp/Fnr family transcriptional regulator [Pseudonocardiaceae bacterium]
MRGTTGHFPEPAGSWSPDSFLGQLTPAEREALLALGRPATHQPGATLLLDGDKEGDFVVILHSGHVKVIMADEQGNDYLIGIRVRGDLLGEMAYIDSGPRSASVIALSPVRSTFIAWDTFTAYLRGHQQVWPKIARMLAARLRASDQSSHEIHSEPVALRAAKLLRGLADMFEERDESGGTIIPLSQVEIAQLARAAEVTVNRVLREFRDHDVLKTEYRRLVVPCLACLDNLVKALTVDPKHGAKNVLGCGGAHQRRRE